MVLPSPSLGERQCVMSESELLQPPHCVAALFEQR